MKFIELHYKGAKYSLRADYIAAVNQRFEKGCEVYLVGDRLNEAWNTDESYEEVLLLIKEASDGKES